MEPLSRDFLLARGYCCNFGCRNCPYAHPVNDRATGRVCTRTFANTEQNDDDNLDT